MVRVAHTGASGSFNMVVPPFDRRVDLARVRSRVKGAAVLYVTHDLGGGTEIHARQMSKRLEAEGVPVIFCRPDKSIANAVRLEDPLSPDTTGLAGFNLGCDGAELEEALQAIGICHIHIHHLAGFPESASDYWVDCARRLNLAYDVTLHDYMAICPRINLTDHTHSYCGEPELARCEQCIARNGSPFGRPEVWVWRARFGRLLASARHVYVPDMDVARRCQRYYPQVPLVVRPHEEQPRRYPPHDAELRPACRKRRIAIVGAIGPHKGSRLLLAVAAHAANTEMPIEFVVVGHTDVDYQLQQLGNVSLTGKYKDENAPDLIDDAGCDAIWFPNTCPETYSYTLSLALASGLFIIAFDLGAIAQRMRAARWGKLLPIEMMNSPDAVALLLSSGHIPLPRKQGLFVPYCYPTPIQQSYYGFSRN